MKIGTVEFVKSVYKPDQLPPLELPEFAFAGRSNVGKSSLINRLLNRKNLVKVSAKPGKTQALNFFLVDDSLYFVDLPGYGFAQVSKKMQDDWQELITDYLASRQTLRCVVVIIDIRHPLKPLDQELFNWLRLHDIPTLPVYTKADKLPRGQQQRQAGLLDAALGIDKGQRVIFSSKSGAGREKLLEMLDLLR